jgi:hypothetical protein
MDADAITRGICQLRNQHAIIKYDFILFLIRRLLQVDHIQVAQDEFEFYEEPAESIVYLGIHTEEVLG